MFHGHEYENNYMYAQKSNPESYVGNSWKRHLDSVRSVIKELVLRLVCFQTELKYPHFLSNIHLSHYTTNQDLCH